MAECPVCSAGYDVYREVEDKAELNTISHAQLCVVWTPEGVELYVHDRIKLTMTT